MKETTTQRPDVVIVSSIDWDAKWQGPQEMAVRFAAQGRRVLFIENPGVRSPRAGDARRLITRARKLVSAAGPVVRTVEAGVHLYTPAVLPPFGSRLRQAVNRVLVRMSMSRALRAVRPRTPIVIVCLPTDVSIAMTRAVLERESVLVYYAISDLVAMTDHPTELEQIERDLIAEADVIFTTYLPLVRRYEIQREDVHLFPYGVNLERFSMDGPAITPHAAPRIGYVGGISQHLDTELIADIAAMRPEWNLILIGPDEPGGEGLPNLPNIHRIGHLRHDLLPGWIRGFDIGLIPYRRSRYTDTVYPVKLNEYLAVGRPVVSVDLPALEGFDEDGVLMLVPPRAQDFVEAIEIMLHRADDSALVQRRRQIAETHDWSRRVEEMDRVIADAAAAKSRPMSRLVP